MSNKTLDLLLGADKSVFVRESKEVEIPRLSRLLGGEVKFNCLSLSATEYAEVQEEMDVDSSGNVSANDVQIVTVIKSIGDFKNKDLQKSFGAVTPKELVNKLLLPGEIAQLSTIILEISGFVDDAVKETITEIKKQ